MSQKYISGAETTCLYAFEDPDGWTKEVGSHTASDETYEPFGQGVEVSISRNNNAERVYGIGARNATTTVNKQYSGTANINGTLTNAYWLLGVLGSNTDGGSAGAYTHTYTESNSLPSFTTKTSFNLGDTDFTAELIGCRVNNCTISAAVNETIKFSLECPYRYENLSESFVSNNADVEPVFTFAHGSIEMPDGTSIAEVQNFELTINNNLSNVYGIGSRFMSDNVATNREYNFNMTAAFNDYTKLLTYFMNGTSSASNPDSGSGTEIATLQLTFTNDDGDILEINLTGVHLNEETLPQNINEVVKEDVSGWARECDNIVYTNDVETAPAEADNIT